MARRRRAGAEPATESAHVDAPEHEWWAAGSTDPYAYARADPEPDPEPEPGPEPEPEAHPPPAELVAEEHPPEDPYRVLRVAPTATWEEIVASHRRLVRWWHPDGLAASASPEERELCDRRMRALNEAYSALRVRRDR